MKWIMFAFLLLAAALPATYSFAQLPMYTTPRVSQAASITQRVGITDITVTYHRPGVKGRPIWDALVPYGQLWRAGANENTTILFTTPVTIGGTELNAGTYGLHVLPNENEWTFIFSRQYQAWGSFSYDETEDAARVVAKPQASAMREWLTYYCDDVTPSTAVITLGWEKLSASFTVEVDVNAIVPQSIRNELRGLQRFSWQGWQQAANWCVQNETNLEEADAWIDRSIGINRNFTNMTVKATIMEMQGNSEQAVALTDQAFQVATEAEVNLHGYQLLGRGEVDRAIAVFERNVEDHPDSWNCYDSLADGYANKGDKQNAIKYYKKALSMVTDDQQKQRIDGVLKGFE